MKAHYVNDAGDLRVIRPFILIIVCERQTADFALRGNLPAIVDNCPACFRMPTQSKQIKALLAEQEKTHKRLFFSLLATIRPLMSKNMPK